MRERCYELAPDRLLTLTKRGKFANVDELWRAFKEFSRLMEVRFGDKWRYVAVPELHADGETYHMHVAVRGFYMYESVRMLWSKALGGKGNERGKETLGNVDFTEPRKFRSRGWSRGTRVRKIAGYIAKYVAKGFGARNRGRRLFSSSRALTDVSVSRWHVLDWLGIPELLKDLQERLNGIGAVGEGIAYLWSRHHSDGRLMMQGFTLTSEVELSTC